MQPILNNPEVMARIRAAARRERAQAVHRMILAPVAGFFRRPKKAEASAKNAAALTAACG